MKPKTIGIIGGAGPLAGAFLLERILTLSGKEYGCYKDADFPQVFLISYPFSEMLSPDRDRRKLTQELSGCLDLLRKNGASVLAIACNTLHVFLEENEQDDLVHLPRTLAEEISLTETPLVFCTSTSAESGLHKQFFPCSYPDRETQLEVDGLIDDILKGAGLIGKLEKLLEAQTAKTIILGCTELSLFSARLSVPGKVIIDPLEVMAKKILKKSFI
jgi:aspartate racemase